MLFITFFKEHFFYGLFIHLTVRLKYIQASWRALNSPPFNKLVISRALKALNINACRVNSNTLLPSLNKIEKGDLGMLKLSNNEHF